MNFQFYSLLYVADGKSDTTNFGRSQSDDHLDIYLRNGLTLSRSLECVGFNLTIITNKPEFLKRRLALMNGEGVQVISIDFDRVIPQDINFYSAHYKLDVYKYFSKLDEDAYSILLDLDMVALTDNWDKFLKLLENKKNPVFYEITNQVVPAYGAEVIEKDLYAVTGIPHSARWFGGEFVGGTSAFYKRLNQLIDNYYVKYTQIYKSLHHQGDEVLTSAAILGLQRDQSVLDAGVGGVVCRYWSARTLHKQVTLREAFNCSFLHLPSDKYFLAKSYSSYARNRLFSNYVKYLLGKIFKKARECLK